VILFECLTGEVPFQGDSEWEVLKKHEEEQVTFPNGMDPTICSIIERMMAKDPEDRYQSVKEILPRLDAVLQGASGGSGAVPPPDPARARSRRIPERAHDRAYRRKHRTHLGNMLKDDIEEMKRVFHNAHKEVRSAGAEIGAAAAEIGGALKEVKFAGGKVATSVGDHVRLHLLIPARRGLESCREGLVSAISGTGKGRRRARGLEKQVGLERPDLSDKGFLSLAFGNLAQVLSVIVLAILIPFRYLGAAVLEVLEFVVKLPYRVFGFIGRMVLVVFGVGVLMVSVFAIVYLMASIPRMFIRF
jgi:hypothetical protein